MIVQLQLRLVQGLPGILPSLLHQQFQMVHGLQLGFEHPQHVVQLYFQISLKKMCGL